MARKKPAQAQPVQLACEKALGTAAILLIAFHTWISFARHLFAPENMISKSETLQEIMRYERRAALLLLCALIAYLIVTRVRYRDTWYRVREAFHRLVCRESVLLAAICGWYVVSCLVYRGQYGGIFKAYDWWLYDMALCLLVMFPVSALLGVKRARAWFGYMFHAVMLFSTGFAAWVLWNLFHLNIVTLPNGLQVGMMKSYSLYAGVNQNIGAAIGTSMVFISLYMIASQRWPLKIVYAVALIPHLLMTLLTNSRANYLALLVTLPLAGFMAVWNRTGNWRGARRILVSAAAAAVIAAVFWWLRSGVFQGFDAVTHFGERIGARSGGMARKMDGLDPARARIWRSSLKLMFSSARRFFFGIPFGNVSDAIREAMKEIYGSGGTFAHAHNMILQVGVCLGVPAMAAFVAFLVMMVVRCIRVGLGMAKGAFAGAYILPIAVLAFMIVNMFEPFLLLYVSVMACLFFLFCGWITTMDREAADA